MDLNEILVFTRVVQAGSFIAASKSLGIPTSTVSRKVAELEERLDTRLLQRTSRTRASLDQIMEQTPPALYRLRLARRACSWGYGAGPSSQGGGVMRAWR
jgi:DNA-binding transcriptional LysR family regulator